MVAPADKRPVSGLSWSELIERAELGGPAGELARNSSLIAIEEGVVRLTLRASHGDLADGPWLGTLEQRLGSALGRPIKVRFERGGGGETPAEQRARVDDERHQVAEQAVHADPVVRSLIDTFGGRVVPGSVRATDG